MSDYTLTTEQFQEIIAPILKQIKHEYKNMQHRQIRFNAIEGQTVDDSSCIRYKIDFDIIGYHTYGSVLITNNNCFELSIDNTYNEIVDLESKLNEMQTSLWEYCYNMFGEEYKQDMLNYFNAQKETRINELTKYINGVVDYEDMYVAENETRAAKKEMEIFEDYYNNCLKTVAELGKSANCN